MHVVRMVKSVTHSLLDLSLVGLDLVLQLVDQVLQTLLVLAVLVRLEGQLLEAAVGLAHVLLGLRVAALLAVQLHLQLAHLKGEQSCVNRVHKQRSDRPLCLYITGHLKGEQSINRVHKQRNDRSYVYISLPCVSLYDSSVCRFMAVMCVAL